MMQHFIKCSDPDTIQKLKALGFQLIDHHNGIATFLNDPTKPMTFDKSKIAYTNVVAMTHA